MLILGDLSGIQDYLFDLPALGAKQAASLRFRSLRLQLIAECVARQVLWRLNLPEQEHLLYCTAGKFAVTLPDGHGVHGSLDAIRVDVEQWLLEQTQGRLKCSIVADATEGSAARRHEAVHRALQRRKLSPWSAGKWGNDALVVAPPNREVEHERDAQLGRRLLDETIASIQLSEQSHKDTEQLAGVSVQLSAEPITQPERGRSSIPLARLARHTPRHPDGSLVEFVELAKRSRGAAMLGVLKADADNLGLAIRSTLGQSTSFSTLRDFSRRLDAFFGSDMDKLMSAPGSRWNNLYTVFAGGDDLLVFGPWDAVIDFAAELRERFMKAFNPGTEATGLTLSAGCAIVKPKFPVRLAAQQAENLLEEAKSGAKDQFALLGDVWKWEDHAEIIDAGKQLADWVDAGDIQRGWLHTLLELALLRREQAPPRDGRLLPAMATSRLSYHVARNWPRARASGEKSQARRWADRLIQHFNRYETTSDPIARHLPAVLRYAMLASRLSTDQESNP